MKTTYYIIDFDSTFIQGEALDLLAEVCLHNNPRRSELVREIQQVTAQGMEGALPFPESLRRRLEIIRPNKKDVEKLTMNLKKIISRSIKANREFFRKHADTIYIISGGFREYILPLTSPFGIRPQHVIANSFRFRRDGTYAGYDTHSPLAHEQGKIRAVRSLNLEGDIVVIGDGYTDFELKEMGAAKTFVAFTENVARERVVKKADQIAPTFDEFLYVNKLPQSLSYPKNRIGVLLLENIDNEAVSLFEKEGFHVEWYDKALDQNLLEEKLGKTRVLGIRSRTHITPDLLSRAPHLLAIGAYCIGTNQIDLPTAARKGVPVFNAPFSNTRSVVELVVGSIIMLSRKTLGQSTDMHQGIWNKTAVESHEIRGKKLGIVGYGHIGSQLSVIAESLGMAVYFYNTSETLALGNAKKCSSLKELLKTSDIVTLHVDGRKENKNLIGGHEFSLMKKGAIFINMSRGFVVDVNALAANLKNGKLRGAAVDVFPLEPKHQGEAFFSPLRGLPNVILTPHVGGSTEEAQRSIGTFVTEKLIDFINLGSTELAVNFPRIIPPQLKKNTHRLLHMHRNEPGILAGINSILANHNANIESQYLKTEELIGYAITDINKKYGKALLTELKNIPQTIKYRVLF